MSYEAVRAHLDRSRRRAADDTAAERAAETKDLIAALDELATTLEADLTQIKAALSHVAHLLETDAH